MKGNLLGSLESRIMELFWQKGQPSSIAELHQHLNKKNHLAYTTVATVANRLVSKGLLSRQKTSSGYIYRIRQSREEFIKGRSRGLIKILLGDFGDVAIAGFVEELKDNPRALKILKDLSHE